VIEASVDREIPQADSRTEGLLELDRGRAVSLFILEMLKLFSKAMEFA